MTKTIKIPADVHKELKLFVAEFPSNMELVAGEAIKKYIQQTRKALREKKKEKLS